MLLKKMSGDTPREAIDKIARVMLKDKSSTVRAACARAIESSGQSATENSIKALVKALHDPEDKVHSAALKALSTLASSHQECLSYLKMALNDSDSTVVSAAMNAVAQMGGAGASLMPDVIKSAERNDFQNGQAVVSAFQRMGVQAAPEAVQFMIRYLQHTTRWSDRMRIAQALQQLGSAAQPSLPALREAAKIKDPATRSIDRAIQIISQSH
jgi:HEAT repeat protein